MTISRMCHIYIHDYTIIVIVVTCWVMVGHGLPLQFTLPCLRLMYAVDLLVIPIQKEEKYVFLGNEN